MIGFPETLVGVLGAFLVPTFISLVIVSAASKILSARYLAAFAVGLYFWFFSDTIGDASLLGASEGLTGGGWHALLWITFAVGLVIVLALDSDMFTAGPAGAGIGFAIPLLVAFAVGLHGFGEGAGIGATAVTTSSTNLLDAFGGLSAASAFLIHKALEPVMVGAAYWVYAKDHAKSMTGRLTDMIVLTLAFTIPGIIGGASSYYIVQVFPDADFTYVFAFALGTSIYAAIRLARPLFEGVGSKSESVKVALALLLGFTCLYLAALLHS